MRRFVEQLMGMPVSLALRGRYAYSDAAGQAWADVVTELRWVDLVFSTWREDSVISRLRRGEMSMADAPPELGEVIALGQQAAEDSDGAFSVWLPDRDGVVRLDPTGVVKGWAVQRASRHLRSLPLTDFCLSAGGDMVCSAHPSSEPWQIGVEDPFRPDQLAAVVPLHTGAVATSGTAHRGTHLVDGRSGRVATGFASVTVVARDLTSADIDATSAFALGDAAEDWLQDRVATGRIAHAVLVTPDGERRLVA